MRVASVILLPSLLALLLCWCLCGNVFWQLHHQWHVRQQEQCHDKDTLLLTRSEWQDPAVVQQVEKHEIRVRGRMFDIRTITPRGDDLLITGHYDREDDAWFSFLKSWYGDDDRSGEESGLHIRLFWLEGFPPEENYATSVPDGPFAVFYNLYPDPDCRYFSLRQEDDPPEGTACL